MPGCGCLICENTNLAGWPGRSFGDAVKAYSDPLGKGAFDSARLIFLQQEENIFQPASSVNFNQFQGSEVSFKVGFLSESDVVKVSELTPKALKQPEFDLMLEQIGCKLKGVFVHLRDCPDDVKKWMRVVKIYSRVEIQHCEHHMTPSDQVRQEQGDQLYRLLSDEKVTNDPPAFKALGRANLPTIPELIEKARKIIEALLIPTLKVSIHWY